MGPRSLPGRQFCPLVISEQDGLPLALRPTHSPNSELCTLGQYKQACVWISTEGGPTSSPDGQLPQHEGWEGPGLGFHHGLHFKVSKVKQKEPRTPFEKHTGADRSHTRCMNRWSLERRLLGHGRLLSVSR